MYLSELQMLQYVKNVHIIAVYVGFKFISPFFLAWPATPWLVMNVHGGRWTGSCLQCWYLVSWVRTALWEPNIEY